MMSVQENNLSVVKKNVLSKFSNYSSAIKELLGEAQSLFISLKEDLESELATLLQNGKMHLNGENEKIACTK